MDNEDKKKLVRYIILGLVAVMVLYAGWFFLTHRRIHISVSGNTDANSQLEVFALDELSKTIYSAKLEPGVSEAGFWVSTTRATVGVKTASIHEQESRQHIEPLLFRTNTVDLELRPQSNSAQVAVSNDSCVLPITKSRVYSFSCTNNGTLKSHVYGEQIATAQLSSQKARRYHFQDGIMEIGSDGIGYRNVKTGEISPVSPPGGSSFSASMQFSPIGSTPAFLLINDEALEMYVYTGISDNQPKVVKFLDIELDETTKIVSLVCDGSEMKIVCFAGSNPLEVIEGEGEAPRGGQYVKFDAQGNMQSVSSIVQESPIDLLLTGEADFYTVLNDFGMRRYSFDGEDVSEIGSIHGTISDLNRIEDTLFYLSDNGIYRLDVQSGASYLVYREPGVRMSNLFVYQGRLYFSAFAGDDEGSGQHTLAYRLDIDKPEERDRIESKLLGAKGLPVLSILPWKNNIYVELRVVNVISDRASGVFLVDPAEKTQKSQEVLSGFKGVGVDVDNYNIYFRP